MKKINFYIVLLFILNTTFFAESKNVKSVSEDVNIEFSIKNLTKCFSLYQNVNTLKEFDSTNYEIVQDWSTENQIRK